MADPDGTVAHVAEIRAVRQAVAAGLTPPAPGGSAARRCSRAHANRP
ncbi:MULTISPECIES: hypothetical protein [unclassified Streptomyces]|nr:hypothetical protein [Streptomyces sp. NBC_00273]